MVSFYEAKQRCTQNQMRLQRIDREFRVTPMELNPSSTRAELIAYYTNDLEDAFLTAAQMRRQLNH